MFFPVHILVWLQITISSVENFVTNEFNNEQIQNNSSSKQHEDTHKIDTNIKTTSFVIQHLETTDVISLTTSLYDKSNISEEDANSILLKTFERLHPVGNWKKKGWFTDDYLKLINSHWLKYPPAAHFVHYTLASFYVCFMIVGIAGNWLVIVMYFRCRSLRTPANTLVINLAVSDCLLLLEAPLFVYNSVHFGPALGYFGCQLYGFIGGLTGTVSIGTLAAISLDRYYVIVYPLSPIRQNKNLRAKYWVVITWIYGAIFSSIPLFNIGDVGPYISEGLLTSCSFDYMSNNTRVKNFIFIYFVAAWVIPFVIILYCYINILKVVIETQKLSRNQKKGSISSRHCKDQEKVRTEIKLAGVVIVVIFVWFFAWTPYAIVALLGIFGQRQFITPLVSMIPAMFCKTASCLDPLIYAVTHPRFRTEIKKILKRGFSKNTHEIERKCWTSNVPDTRVIQRTTSHQQFNSVKLDSSECEVEELMVMVDLPSSSSSGKRVLSLKDNHQKISPEPDALREKILHKPPSWYVKPKFTNQKSTSIKSVCNERV